MMQWIQGAVLHGKYRVGRPLGEGGMGAVFQAEHVGIGRTVALKVIRPDLLSDPSAAERFMREARAAGALEHRHVVNVTDFGIDQVAHREVAYLVMEYLRGETLEQVLESGGRLPLSLVVDIVEQVAAALTAAHQRGIVHRDLKPANIWLTPDSRGGFHVQLLDFGIAKLRDDRFGSPEEPQRATRWRSEMSAEQVTAMATQVGESIGTPAYMSPEQCVGDAVDARSDLYSLGVVVFQMLSGGLPFKGDTVALLRQHFVAEVPPLPQDAAVPLAVEAVLRRALSKEPDARYQSTAAFAAALRANAAGFGESMRRALVVFADRLPELATLGACFAVPGLVAAVLLVATSWLPLFVQPLIWPGVLLSALWVATPLSMASISAVFGDLREKPFVPISWREVARTVSGSSLDGVPLYVAWVRTAVRQYVDTSKRSNGRAVTNMILFVDRFRHQGQPTDPARLEEMARVMPTKAFATMAITQLAVLLLLPVGVMLFGAGILSVLHIPVRPWWPLVAASGGVAFAAGTFLQVFVALVDVMLYDLAYAMSDQRSSSSPPH